MRRATDVGIGTELLGRYVVEELITVGARADTWVLRARATFPPHPRVAIKLAAAPASSAPATDLALERTAKLLRGLDHPGVVRCRELDREDGHALLVCDWAPGRPLGARLVRGLAPRERSELALHVLELVDYLHRRHVLHRDLKPSNILVELDVAAPRPIVIDFDLARSGCGLPGEPSGSPRWTAPEQTVLPASWLDFRADLYAIGTVLHLIFTGHELFASRADALRAHARGVPPPTQAPDGVTPALWTVIRGLLEPERHARYASAEAALEDLRAAVERRATRGPARVAPPRDAVEDVAGELSAGLAEALPREIWVARIEELHRARASGDELTAATVALELGRPRLALALVEPRLGAPPALLLAARAALALYDPAGCVAHAGRALAEGADPLAARVLLARGLLLAGDADEAARTIDALPPETIAHADLDAAKALAELWTAMGDAAGVIALAEDRPDTWRPVLPHLIELLRPHLRPRPPDAVRASALTALGNALIAQLSPGDDRSLLRSCVAELRDEPSADGTARLLHLWDLLSGEDHERAVATLLHWLREGRLDRRRFPAAYVVPCVDLFDGEDLRATSRRWEAIVLTALGHRRRVDELLVGASAVDRARIGLLRGEPDAALHELEAAPGSEVATFLRGLAHAISGRLDDATAALAPASASPEAARWRAAVLLRGGRPEACLALLQRAPIARDPILCELAVRSLAVLGRRDAAIALTRELDAQPGLALRDHWWVLSDALGEEIAGPVGERDELEAGRAAVARDARDAATWARWMVALDRAGRVVELEEAFAACRRAGVAAEAPRFVEQEIRLARGQLAASIAVGREARDADPSAPGPCVLLAIAHLALGELDRSWEELREARARGAEASAIARVALAAAVAAGEEPAALTAATTARSLCPDDADVALLAGLVWWHAGRTKDAAEAWRGAAAGDPGSPVLRAALARPSRLTTMSPPIDPLDPAWTEIAWWAHVRVLRGSGWPTEAARAAEEALARNPGSMLLRKALATARRDQETEP